MVHRVLLECGHTRMFSVDPVPTQVVFCGRCNAPSMVPTEIPATWHVRCQDCRLSRSLGAAPLSARVLASSHRLRTGHDTLLTSSTGWSEMFTRDGDDQLSLFGDDARLSSDTRSERGT